MRAKFLDAVARLGIPSMRTGEARGADMALQRRIGEHDIRVDDDGIMTVVFRGPLGTHDMGELLKEHDGKLEADGDLYVISDLRAIASITPGARHALGTRSKTLPGYCVAYLVASFQVKLLLEVFLRAASLLMKAKVQHRFFDDETSARQWLVEMRRSRA
jgi:hypothetical protein